MLQHNNVWRVVIKAMRRVIISADPWGTGRIRFGINAKYSVAAKTGTAQVISTYGRDEDGRSEANIPKKLRNHSLFIAFAPIKHPKIAIAVVVENSPIAGTVARKVLDYYLLQENKHAIIQSTS